VKPGKLPHCQGCPLADAPGPVWGQGSRDSASIIYIGQNPGQQEVASGQPFVGPSGSVFNRQLYEANIKRHNVYVTNQVKCLTPGNRTPTPEEVAHCKPILTAELAKCKADTILLSGALAFRENIGSYSTLNEQHGIFYKPPTNINTRRGCVEVRDGKKWIGTIHPAAIMRFPDYKLACQDDLRKAGQLAGKKLPTPSINLFPTDDEVRDYATYIRTETKHFSDDFETAQHDVGEEDDYIGGDYVVDMCGLSADGVSALVCNPSQLGLLVDLLRDSSITRYEHNRMYEGYHWERRFPGLFTLYDDDPGWEDKHNRYFDTMIASQYLRSHVSHKLKPGVLSCYTNLPYYDRSLEKCDRRLYNAYDVMATTQAGIEMERRLEMWQLTELFEHYGMGILRLNEEIRREGMTIDLGKAIVIGEFAKWRIEYAKVLSTAIVGPNFNLNSPKQCKELFYDKWGLPTQYNEKYKDGEYVRSVTTDQDARDTLQRWIESRPKKEQPKYEEASRFMTLLNYINFEEGKLEVLQRISPDGKIHPYFKAHGQQFYRLSSKPNVQNWNKSCVTNWGGAKNPDGDAPDPLGLERPAKIGSLRSIVIPDHPGHWILSCDLSSAQLAIYGFLYDIPFFVQSYGRGHYIHGAVYEHLWHEPFFDRTGWTEGMPLTKARKLKTVSDNKLRMAKSVPLGFLFKRSAGAVAAQQGWPLSEGQRLQKWFMDQCNPQLRNSWSSIEYKVKQHGMMRLPNGAITWFPNGKVSDAINSRAQSPEAFIIMDAMLTINSELRRRGLREKGNRIILSVHDAISLNCTDQDIEEVYEDIVVPALSKPITWLNGLVLQHEAEVSKMWDWGPKGKPEDYEHWKRNRSTQVQHRDIGGACPHSVDTLEGAQGGATCQPRLVSDFVELAEGLSARLP
jgi:DNA polymerase